MDLYSVSVCPFCFGIFCLGLGVVIKTLASDV